MKSAAAGAVLGSMSNIAPFLPFFFQVQDATTFVFVQRIHWWTYRLPVQESAILCMKENAHKAHEEVVRTGQLREVRSLPGTHKSCFPLYVVLLLTL